MTDDDLATEINTAIETEVDVEPTTDSAPSQAAQAPQARTKIRVLLLGSGNLGRELVTAFQRLGAEVIAVDHYAGAPAHGIADESVVAKLTDPDELAALIERLRPDHVVASTDALALDALAAATGDAELVPTARTTRLTLDREGLRRLAADDLGLPTAPFWFAGSVDELGAIAEHAGFPLVIKPVVAVPGEGQSVLLRADDVEPAWQRAVSAGGRVTHNRVLAETVVEIDYEVTLLTVREEGPNGSVLHFCEPIGHLQADSFGGQSVLECWQPQQMNVAALDAAKSIAARITNALGGRGVYSVELLVRGDEVYFSDVHARPRDTGLVTLRSQRLSEFDLHARAVLGLPVDTIMISPGAAEVIYSRSAGNDHGTGDESEAGPSAPTPHEALTEALGVPESDIRVFGQQSGFGGFSRRPLAVALATAPNVLTARDRVRQVSTALRKLWQP